jgi:hypothetical protein
LKFLEIEGYVVVKEVIDSDKINTAVDLTWNFLESLKSGKNKVNNKKRSFQTSISFSFSGLQRNEMETWCNANWPPRLRSGGKRENLQIVFRLFSLKKQRN